MRTVAKRVIRVMSGFAAAAIAAAVATPGWAHVTVDPDQATPGTSSLRVVFLAPTEGQDAATTGLEVHFPDQVPIVGVATVPVPGWTAEVTHSDLEEPVTDHHGAEITTAVSSITWTAERDDAAIAPGEAGEFPVVFGMVPDADELVFRALQHYSDGEVVRWIELPEPDGGEPHFPAPVLRLDAATGVTGADDPAGGADATTETAGTQEGASSEVAQSSSAALWTGIAGLVAGLTGMLLGGLAYARRAGNAMPERPAGV